MNQKHKDDAWKRAKNKIEELGYQDGYGKKPTPSNLRGRLETNSAKKANETYYKGDLAELYYNMDSMDVDDFLDIVYNVKKKNDAEE